MKKLAMIMGVIVLSVTVMADPAVSKISIIGDWYSAPSSSTTMNLSMGGSQYSTQTLDYGRIGLGIQGLWAVNTSSSLGLGFESFINSSPVHVTPIYAMYDYHIVNRDGVLTPSDVYVKGGIWSSTTMNDGGFNDVNFTYAGLYLALGLGYDLTRNISMNVQYNYFNNSVVSSSFGTHNMSMGVSNGSNSLLSLGLAYNINLS